MGTETFQNSLDAKELNDSWNNGDSATDGQFEKSAEQPSNPDDSGLQMISIRLPKGLIADFKIIAQANGLKYQTLMRQTLIRFADAEKRQMRSKAGSQPKPVRKPT